MNENDFSLERLEDVISCFPWEVEDTDQAAKVEEALIELEELLIIWFISAQEELVGRPPLDVTLPALESSLGLSLGLSELVVSLKEIVSATFYGVWVLQDDEEALEKGAGLLQDLCLGLETIREALLERHADKNA